ncbi:methionine ABC transporter ATP-binding protein MetN [Pedobacter duraquae]|uniref:D-methionine transport system ATP-binding protein n=1 Tax=Pedobacter duraquae TaxID=425511 RepID=A0A4R6IK96_9SPHI|nr:methionine ABC transporter ATP-binding protein MetN [Pedobacter duraquae]TDO22453.1 D-methionine transport system ATP-binding protein [Pedobacter duraquae]
MIILKNLNKDFHQKNKKVTALANVSLEVKPGKIFGIIGASGAGKSTLIRCVNLLEVPDSGEVIVDGRNLMTLSSGELSKARREIGMIFQHFNLLSSRTVSGNVAFPLELAGMPKRDIAIRVSELLSLVGLAEKATDYPATLSGGQKQRLAIARTLACNPKILLCDEATSALDPATTKSILELLKDINRRFNITILLITHEMDVVKSICDEVAVISEGKLVEQGTVSEIFAHPKTELTSAFIKSAIKVTVPDFYRDRLHQEKVADSNPLLKLGFTGDTTDSAVISEASQRFAIKYNIITAQIEYAGAVKFGVMIVEVTGASDQHEQAMNWFKTQHIIVEELGYV